MLSSVKLASPNLLLLAPAAVERTLVERALTLTPNIDLLLLAPAAVELLQRALHPPHGARRRPATSPTTSASAWPAAWPAAHSLAEKAWVG